MRCKKKSAFRGSGGVSVFINDIMRSGRFRRIFENYEDCVILYFDCNHLFSIDNDIIFIFTYVSPEYSPIYYNANNNGISVLVCHMYYKNL